MQTMYLPGAWCLWTLLINTVLPIVKSHPVPSVSLSSGYSVGPAHITGFSPSDRALNVRLSNSKWTPEEDDSTPFPMVLLHFPGISFSPPPAALAFISPHAYLCFGSVTVAEQLMQLKGVAWLGPYLPHYKLAPPLQPNAEGHAAPSHKEYYHLDHLIVTVLAKETSTQGMASNVMTWLQTDLCQILRAYHADATVAQRSLILPLGTLLIDCREICSEAALNALAQHPYVIHLEPDTIFRVQNKFARGILQSGTAGIEPLLDAGLDGAGEIAALSDTGIDHDHCMFFDPDVPTPISTTNLKHRKIIRYDHLPYDNGPGATRDAPKGHGTHVAGSLVGDTDNPALAPYHGGAPKAKAVFYDLGPGMTDGAEDHVSMPGSLHEALFPPAYTAGARVSSNSWGGGHSEYNSYAVDSDTFAHGHPDFLIVYAVGNDADGHCESQYDNPKCDAYTVLAPSTAKNVLSVGASQNPLESWAELDQADYVMRYQEKEFFVVLAHFSAPPSQVIEKQLILSEPIDACQDMINCRQLQGKVAVIVRGNCFFTLKVGRAAMCHAVAVVIINNVPGEAIIMGKGDDTKTVIPAYMVSQTDGQYIQQLLQDNPSSQCSFPHLTFDPRLHKSAANLADFSSRGPTRDLRFKPEVVAPGIFIQSARSDGNTDSHNCDLEDQMGTSMATPFVASMAVLLRQYFREGYHPGGEKGSGPALTPSAALLKAILINAAEPLTGLVDRNAKGDWQRLDEVPSFQQGHGLVTMTTVLPLKTWPNKTGLWFADEGPELATGQSQVHCVHFPFADGRDFKATLVWRDPLGASFAAWTLANDLDLKVISPDGKAYFGNVAVGQPHPQRDFLNNHEKVRIPRAREGIYTIVVSAFNVPLHAQTYAITATGLTTSASCDATCTCSGHGSCEPSNSICHCTAGYYGADCSQFATVLRSGVPVQVTVYARNWVYFQFETTRFTKNVVVKMDRINKNADPNTFLQKNSLPTYRDKWMSDEGCDTCRDVTNRLSFSLDKQNDAVYYVGLEVSCCFAANVTLVVNITSSQPTVHGLGTRPLGPPHVDVVVHPDELIYILGDHLEDHSSCNFSFQAAEGQQYGCNATEQADTWLGCSPKSLPLNVPLALMLWCNGVAVELPGVMHVTVRPTVPEITGISSAPDVEDTTLQNRYCIATNGSADVYVWGNHLCDHSPGDAKLLIGDEACPALTCGKRYIACHLDHATLDHSQSLTLTYPSLNFTLAPPVHIRFGLPPEVHSLLAAGPGSSPVTSLVGSYRDAVQGGLDVWLQGDHLGLLNDTVDVLYGPTPLNTTHRCAAQPYVSEHLLHCHTSTASPYGVPLVLRVQTCSISTLVEPTTASLSFAGPPSISGISWTMQETHTALNVVWGRCIMKPCTFFVHGNWLGQANDQRNATLLSSSSAPVLYCQVEHYISEDLLECHLPGSEATLDGQTLTVSVSVDGFEASNSTVVLNFVPKPTIRTVSAPGMPSVLDVSGSLILTSVTNGTSVPLHLMGDNLAVPGEVVYIWVQDAQAVGEPWSRQCIVQASSISAIDCILDVTFAPDEADFQDLKLEFVVQVGDDASPVTIDYISLDLQLGSDATVSIVVQLPDEPQQPSSPASDVLTDIPAQCFTGHSKEIDAVTKPGFDLSVCSGHGRCVDTCICEPRFFGPLCGMVAQGEVPLAQPSGVLEDVVKPDRPILYVLEGHVQEQSEVLLSGEWSRDITVGIWQYPAEVGQVEKALRVYHSTGSSTTQSILVQLPVPSHGESGDLSQGSTQYYLLISSAAAQPYRIAFSAAHPVVAKTTSHIMWFIFFVIALVVTMVPLLFFYLRLRRLAEERSLGDAYEMVDLDEVDPTLGPSFNEASTDAAAQLFDAALPEP